MWNWRRRSDEDFAAEIHAHISHEMKRLAEEEGLSFQEARRQALISFGNVTTSQERFYESRRLMWLDDLRRDIAYGVRSLRNNPGFAVVAILTLAIGIGATTAIYSVVDSILFQPLPFANSDRLVRLSENFTVSGGFSGRVFQRGMSYQEFLDWRTRTTTLTDVIAFDPGQILVRTDDGPKRLYGATTSANTFALLEARAMLGRTLLPSDEESPDVVVLGYAAWTRLFRSDPTIVDSRMQLQGADPGRALTIVGVLPPGFEFPAGPMDFYRSFDPARRPPEVRVIGKLRPGVSIQAAADEANVIGNAIRPPRAANAPPMPVPRFEVRRLKDEIVKDLRPALRLLLAAVAAVLMIVSANVASLLLARGTARQREFAMRAAIGASRGRIVRQALTECLVLAIAGGTIGALLGAGGVMLVKRLALIEAPGLFGQIFGETILPRGGELGVDVRVFVIAFGIAAITCIVFGVLPAFHLSRANQTQALGSRSGGARRRDARLRSALVVGQLVMATVLLIGAGLLINSFVTLTSVNKGYDASNVLAVQLLLPGNYPVARKADTIDTLLARLRSLPSVHSAGFSRAGVLIGEEIIVGTFVPRGRTVDEMRNDPDQPRVRSVSDGFLPAMGVRFIGGRDLSASDRGATILSVVLNRPAATRLFGRQNPVGEIVDWDLGDFHIDAQVVGVVEGLRNESLEHEPFPEIFINYRDLLAVTQRQKEPPVLQNQTALGVLSLAIRTRTDPQSTVQAITDTVRSVDANAGIDAIVPVERLVASSLTRQRFYALLLSIFAGVAGVLAAIGIYGVAAYSVGQRTQEIGIRMVLGAQQNQVLGLVLQNGLILASTGIVLGLVCAAAGSRLLQGMLFGVTPLDPATFVAVSLIFGLITTVASYVPARRALKVNPWAALRTE